MKVSRKQIAALGASALVLLGVGNVVLAGDPQSQPSTPASETALEDPTKGPDTDKIEEGDQTSPDAVDEVGPAGRESEPGAESEAASEVEGAEAEGAEADGPGGHEDPAGANVDHQFEGKE